jgi:small subunit ribosomal protein S1
VISAHRPGDVLGGTVTKVVAFGAFVEILPGVEGLVHISELADHHVESPSEVVEPGAALDVKILEIDEERRRLSLSIKQVEEQKMPMGDLSEQIAAAGSIDEGSDAEAAGPVVTEDSSSSQQAAGEEPTATPPADGTSEDIVDESAAGVELAEEAPASEVEESAVEEVEPAAAEEPAAEEAPAEVAEEPVAEAPEEGGEEQEGESVQERPDSPDDTDEAAGESSEAESPAEEPSES